MSYSDGVRMSTAILLVLVLLSLFSVVHCDPVMISDAVVAAEISAGKTTASPQTDKSNEQSSFISSLSSMVASNKMSSLGEPVLSPSTPDQTDQLQLPSEAPAFINQSLYPTVSTNSNATPENSTSLVVNNGTTLTPTLTPIGTPTPTTTQIKEVPSNPSSVTPIDVPVVTPADDTATKSATLKPISDPTDAPTMIPAGDTTTKTATSKPISDPTDAPTVTSADTSKPISDPTDIPTVTSADTSKPISDPTDAPAVIPADTSKPISDPTDSPTVASTDTSKPISDPTDAPAVTPAGDTASKTPTVKPTPDPNDFFLNPGEEGNQIQSKEPSVTSTQSPTSRPSINPSASRKGLTPAPTTMIPSSRPSISADTKTEPPQAPTPKHVKSRRPRSSPVASPTTEGGEIGAPSASTSTETLVPTVVTLFPSSLAPTPAAIPDGGTNTIGGGELANSGADSASDDGFSSYWITFTVAALGMLGLYLFYRYLLGGKSTSGPGGNNASNKGSYSPVSQNEGDLELARQNNADDWDDWEEPKEEKKSSTTSLFPTMFTGKAPTVPGRSARKEKKRKPQVNMDDWDDELDLGSAEEDEEDLQDDADRATEHDSFLGAKSKPAAFKQPSSSHGYSNHKPSYDSRSKSPGSVRGDILSHSHHGIDKGVDALNSSNSHSSAGSFTLTNKPPTSFGNASINSMSTNVKKSNKYQLPVEDVDLFASIGLTAAPKMKGADMPDMDNMFGSLAGQDRSKFPPATTNSTPAKVISKPPRSSKPASSAREQSPSQNIQLSDRGRLATALSASDAIIHDKQWDEDKELDALIGDD